MIRVVIGEERFKKNDNIQLDGIALSHLAR